MGHGWEIVEAKLPVLVTVINTANQPRPPAAKRVMRYKRARVQAEIAAEVQQQMPQATDAERAAEVLARAEALNKAGLMLEQWNLDDIHADLDRCGLAGSPTKVFRVQAIVLTKAGYTAIPPTEEGDSPVDPRTGRGPHAGMRTRSRTDGWRWSAEFPIWFFRF